MPVLPLGLACVAEAAVRAGHNAVLLDLMGEPDPGVALKQAVTSFRPECIGVSVRNIDDQNMERCRFLLEDSRAILAACRELTAAPLIVGGAGFSIFPESALAYLGADMGIAGEGEAAFVSLLGKLEQGGDPGDIEGIVLPGRSWTPKTAFSRDLDAWPLPDTAFLRASAAKIPGAWIPVQTRRGCPLRCSYCSTPRIEGTASRKRDPEQVVEWLQEWAGAGYHNFYFVDNTFNFPLSYAKELCRRILERKLELRWQAIIYPKQVDDELAALMAAAGCCHVSLGFESGSPPVLRQLNKRFSPDEVSDISGRFADHGIERMGFLLLGGPGETRETVEESLKFADSLRLEMLQITAGIRIYPGTPLAALAREQGVIAPDDNLLQPRYYLAEGLKGWILPRLQKWKAGRSNVIL